MIDEAFMLHSTRRVASIVATIILLLSACSGTHESKEEAHASSGGKLVNDVVPPLVTPEQSKALSKLAPLSSSRGDDPDDAEQRRGDSERDYQIHKLQNRMDELEREQKRQEIDRGYDQLNQARP